MTIFRTGIAVVLTTLSLSITAINAQAAANQTAHKNIILPEKYNRTSAIEPAIEESSVDIRVVRNFRKSFPHASEVKWKLTANHYFATFSKGPVKHKIVYRLNGGMDYHLKMYNEAQLPADVRKAVKSVYVDHSITTAQELILNNRTVYLIQLSGENDWKTIRVSDGGIEEIEYIQKTPLK